jgi:S-(hydroxymethyl)glutathione dehydrogenase/alcohol dehydrogenase
VKIFHRKDAKVELHAADLVFQEKRVIGSLMGSNRFRLDMPRYVDFYLDGRLKLDEMISARIGLADVNDAFDAMRKGEAARQVIVFD